ncbi:MAG: porin PorA family protein [Gordonia sp. (in: high G+C Gram-positive bacteria)]
MSILEAPSPAIDVPAPPPEPPARRRNGAVAPLLIMLSALCLTVAAVLALGAAGTASKIAPFDRTVVSETPAGAPARLLDPCSVNAPQARVVSAPVVQRSRQRTIAPPDDHVVTVEAGSATAIAENRGQIDAASDCRQGLLTAVVDQTTIDRTTALPAPAGPRNLSRVQILPAAGGNAGRQVQVERSGLQYQFPLNADGSAEHPVFDLTTRTVATARRSGSSTVDGVPVAVFTADLGEHPVVADTAAGFDHPATGSLTRPAGWFPGLTAQNPDEPVTVRLVQSGRRTFYVEPSSGIIVKQTSTVEMFLTPAADYRLTYFAATLETSADTQRELAADARRFRSDERLRRTTSPLALTAAGLIALGTLTVILSLRRRRAAETASDHSS